MDKYMHEKYINVLFNSEQLKMIIEHLNSRRDCLELLKIIFVEQQKDNIGITKDKITKNYSITNYKCSIALEFLLGAGLVYMETKINSYGKFIKVSSRGCQVLDQLKTNKK